MVRFNENNHNNNTFVFTYIGNPIVSITTSGSNIAGNMYSLLCSVSVVFGTPNITWFYSNGTKLLNSSGTTQTLTTISETKQTYKLHFNPLMYTHSSEYTCVASLTVIHYNDTFIGVSNVTTTVYVTSKFNTIAKVKFYSPCFFISTNSYCLYNSWYVHSCYPTIFVL